MLIKKHENIIIFREYLKEFFNFSPAKLITYLVMTIFAGITQGISLLTLIPFLSLAGLVEPAGHGSRLTTLAGTFFQKIRLPFTLPYALIIFVLVIAFNASIAYYQSIFNTGLHQGFIRKLRNRIYALAVCSQWNFILKTKSSDITNILTTEVNNIQIVTTQFLSLFSSVFIIAAHVTLAFMVSAQMSVLVIITATLLSMTYIPWNLKVSQTGKSNLRRRRKLMFSLSEHLNGIKISKSYGKEAQHIRQFETLCGEIEDEAVNLSGFYARSQAVFGIGSAIALSVFVYIGITLIHLQAGELVILIFIFSRLLPLFSQFQRGIQQIFYYLPGFKSVLDFEKDAALHTERHINKNGVDQSIELTDSIIFKNVGFLYDTDEKKYAVKNLNFSFKANQTTAIIGHSGAGKSTMADLIMGLLTPPEGSITIDNEPLNGSLLGKWRNSVGYVPQEPFLFNDTVRANLLWANALANEDEIWEALKITQCLEFVERLPQKLDTVTGERGVQISGGERQRIALARALIRKPTLLLLDEATNSLDTENERLIQQALDKLHGRLTIIIIAHRLSTIRNADNIIRLDKGRIAQAGSWDELNLGMAESG